MAIRIHDVSPRQGWPGTLVEITGEGFDPHRASNTVIVGNRPALVVRASPQRLLVMAAEDARTGEIRVEVGPESADGPAFELLPYPEEHGWVAPAAPRFVHGPQNGTPSVNVQNQRVLVLSVFPTDQAPLGPPVSPTRCRRSMPSSRRSPTFGAAPPTARRYTVQVLTGGSPHAAETESETRDVDL
ncbi:IPT/TIG domain-containing protein [Saccharopolyspora phatthalungensis]|uniref:IPT/TIG domain-containing protein n=1 Tax=Saccharopolyspora phatthalungensis TaxID=664693 RepID=A0A840QG83_9PSEU|nr:IPT/TIG domain-containing protein [Saccharopolyspora phatthalungensis]MBB5159854.1 hypothetical protein [Saccharopolyspora phatthalungensis]